MRRAHVTRRVLTMIVATCSLDNASASLVLVVDVVINVYQIITNSRPRAAEVGAMADLG